MQGDGRRAHGVSLVGGLGLGLLGCVQIGAFPCSDDAQCELDGRTGRCLSPGYCALPDDACDSGYRWHDRSTPEDLAGQCASLPEGTSSTGADPSSSSGSSSSSHDSSASSSGSSSGSITDDGSSSSSGNPCGDHPCPCTQSVATGANHTCAVRTDGHVVCWGANNQGQLGQGVAGAGPIPEPQSVVIPGEALIQWLQASNNGTCGLGSDDALWCWGDNNNGEITTPAGAPPSVVSPTALPVDGSPGALGQGQAHTCIGEPGGPGVRCLGNNTYSELGGGGTQPIDGAVPGMNPVDWLALGNDHSCALANGQVWCWGRDNVGQLGQNDVPGPTADPASVSLPSAAILLVAGHNHNCAAINGGMAVRCWGKGDLGQIGDGTTNNRQLPNAIAMTPPAPVVALQAMVDTTCMLLADESLWCWGDDNGGFLGTDVANNTPLLVPTRVLTVDALPEPIVSFSLGAAHLCGLAESGRLWCWGRNTSWQLGPDPPLPGVPAIELDVECPEG
ncbi:RCC1 domain-containing protein [Paraliomyxa miuraensis]|uniref:RCC1 domain-containing protein n=1 Tax=Paraliomyxa miuraensis TaxID=376150 RepID=UPI00225BBD23|nr:RCC1 domain-containing protein [Paraliomyxa miuraensis]MCX4247382.1 hypothetical protein [Paraliomyxa miuraensis]